MKQRISVLVAAFLAVTAGMTILASSASAHDTQINVGVACDNGDYEVTWTVKNWSGGGTGTILESSRSVVPVGTQFADGQTKTFSETVPAPATLTLTLKTKWSADGYIATNSGTLQSSEFPGACTKPDVPVTPEAPSVTNPTCSVAGSLVVPANTDKVTYGQQPAGSGPGTYTVTATAKPGYTIEGQSSWTLTVLPKKSGDDCLTPVTPTPPSANDPTCDADGSLVVPANTDKVTYDQQPLGSGPGTYTVIATAAAGYKIVGPSSWTITVLAKKSGAECAVAVTPEAPSVTDPSCSVAGTLVVPADTDKVAYTQEPAGSGPGTYTVTATAKPGYKIDGQSSWTLTVEPVKTGAECLIPVTAQAASVTDPSCDVAGTLVVPADTDKVAYTQEPAGSGPGTYTVTATAKPGYTLTGTTSWLLTVLPKLTEGCAQVVTPAAPAVTTITACGTYGSVVFAETPGVSYALTEGDGKSGLYEVTATATEGYVIAEGAPSVFGGNLGAFTECEPPVVEPPTTEPPGGSTVTPPGEASVPPGDTVLPDTGAGDLVPLGIVGLLVIGLGAVMVRRSART